MAKAAKRKKARPTKKQTVDIKAKQAQAYSDMENSVCEIVRMGEITMDCFDDPDRGKFVFAVGHLEWMLHRFKDRYRAMEFPAVD
jgi:hypothetical protein